MSPGAWPLRPTTSALSPLLVCYWPLGPWPFWFFIWPVNLKGHSITSWFFCCGLGPDCSRGSSSGPWAPSWFFIFPDDDDSESHRGNLCSTPFTLIFLHYPVYARPGLAKHATQQKSTRRKHFDKLGASKGSHEGHHAQKIPQVFGDRILESEN